MIRDVEDRRARRIVLITWCLALAVLPLLWVHRASSGSQEYVDDDGEIRDTLMDACLVMLGWALIVGATVRPLRRSVLVAGAGGASALAALTGALRWGYGRIDRTPVVLEPGFWERMTGLALRGLILIVLGVALGYLIRGIAERFGRRPRLLVVSFVALGVGAVTELLGAQLPRGRFQLSTYIAGWLHGERLIYRPTADCPAGPCSAYLATWQSSLPVLAAVAATALLAGRWCRPARAAPPPGARSADA